MIRIKGKTYLTWPKVMASRESIKFPATPARLKKLRIDKTLTMKSKIEVSPRPMLASSGADFFGCGRAE